MRAILVEPIGDELVTLFYYVDYGTFIGKDAVLDANNHLLNSFLAWLSYSVFGDHIWAIRLPNVLSFLLFFLASYKISLFLNQKQGRFMLLVAFTCIPFVLDYFAYSRGYGLSMALLMYSLFLVLKNNHNFSFKKTILATAIILLGVYANLNLLLTAFLILGCIGIQVYNEVRRTKSNSILYQYLALIVLFLLALAPALSFSFAMKEAGRLYYGSQGGLWNTTGTSLSQNILFTSSVVIKYVCIALLVFFVFHLFYIRRNIKDLSFFKQPSVFFILILFGNLVGILLMRKLLDVNFPSDRVGMHLIFMVLGAVAFSFSHYILLKRANIVFVSLPIIGAAHFNFSTSVYSPYDRMEQNEYELLKENLKDHPTFSVFETQALTYAYHVRTSNPTDFSVPNTFRDETFYNEALVSSRIDGINEQKSEGYKVLTYNPNTWQTVLKCKEKVEWKHYKTIQVEDTVLKNGMYHGFIDSTWREIQGRRIKFELDCEVYVPKPQRESLLLVIDQTIEDSRAYNSFNLGWMAGKNRKYRFHKSVEIQPDALGEFAFYVYNPNQIYFKVLQQSVRIMVVD